MSHRLTISRTAGPIGPAGIAARLLVGSTLIAVEIVGRDPEWWDPFLALGMAALATTLMAVRARGATAPLHATGPVPHVLTVVLAGLLIYLPPTSGGALLFYGLDAARRGPPPMRLRGDGRIQRRPRPG